MTVTAYATAPPPVPARRSGSDDVPTLHGQSSKIRAITVPEELATRLEPILKLRRRDRSQFCVDIVRSYTLGDFDPNSVRLPRYLHESERGYGVKQVQYRLDDEAFNEFTAKVKQNAANPELNNRATGKPWKPAQIIAAGMQLATSEAWRDLPF
jgi:hypothetical protein